MAAEPGVAVFDAYGTLFDVTSAARRLAAEPGEDGLAERWSDVARDWRTKQIAYTWLRSITGAHADFRTVTRDALDWAMEANGLADARRADRLMALYDALDLFPDAAPALAQLRADGHRAAILSNGTPEMLRALVGAAGIADAFDHLISVESAGVFKPDAAVYRLVEAEIGVPPAATLFVSSNGWDAAGAAGFGFEVVWVNRAGEPVDRLPWTPARIVADLSTLPDLARRA